MTLDGSALPTNGGFTYQLKNKHLKKKKENVPFWKKKSISVLTLFRIIIIKQLYMIMQFLMKIKNIQFYIFSDFNFVF